MFELGYDQINAVDPTLLGFYKLLKTELNQDQNVVPQRDPAAEPRYGIWGRPMHLFHKLEFSCIIHIK